jgi:3-hydroxyisobutyrate dehydrogenase-like beta-hydroxyacid dehydrogenase
MAIGFIGLGSIGKPMARHLLKLDEAVWVYDVAPAPVAELAEQGAHAAADLKTLAQNCRIVGLCVRDDDDVNALLHGAGGLLQNLKPDSVIAVHSTVTHASVLRWAAEAGERRLHLIDAPITGGAAGAEAAKLCYMVGGPEHIVAGCKPIFSTSGDKIIHAGGLGAGIALKLCNNLMTYAAFTAMHEAASLARAGGLTVEQLIEVGRSNGVVTPQMEAFWTNRERLAAAGPEALEKFFRPFANLGRKDLLAALRSAEELKVALPLGTCLSELIEAVFMKQY